MTNIPDTKLEKIKRQIRAMLDKTTSNGATEGEAISAAEKAAELMLKWDVEIADLEEPRKDAFKESAIVIDLDMEAAFILVGIAIAKLCQCRFILEGHGNSHAFFFGEEQDSEIAQYLMTVCTRAIKDETKRSDRENSLFRKNVKHRKRLGFLLGISTRLAQRINTLEARRRSAPGNSLVVSKLQTVEDELNLRFDMGGKIYARKTISDQDAEQKGKEAAEKIPLNSGLASGQQDTKNLNFRR